MHVGRVARANPHNPQKKAGWAKIFGPFSMRAILGPPHITRELMRANPLRGELGHEPAKIIRKK